MKPDYETLVSQTVLLPTNKSRTKLSRIARLKSRLSLYHRHYRTRRQLLLLSPDQLRDIGVTSEQAQMEAKKFFWE